MEIGIRKVRLASLAPAGGRRRKLAARWGPASVRQRKKGGGGTTRWGPGIRGIEEIEETRAGENNWAGCLLGRGSGRLALGVSRQGGFFLFFLFCFPKHFQIEKEFKIGIKQNHTTQNKIMTSINAKTCY